MKGKTFYITVVAIIGLAGLISCSQSSSGNLNSTDGSNSASSVQLESYSAKPSNFRVSLTDAPSQELKSVFVNVASAEIWISKAGKEARVQIAKDLGMVDLLTLRNGVLLPLQDINLPEGVTVSQIRLVLADGNYAVKADDSQCALQTPSAQQSGVKIFLSNPVTIQGSQSYSLVIDFDAAKSVVVKGNGGCLLKPVLKLASFTKVDQENIDDDGNSNTQDDEGGAAGEDLTNGTGGTSSADSSSDFDGTDTSAYPPIVDPNDVSYLF
ncbi:MAG: DUF4382 domain-containing protein [Bdellovibrionales bacterium]|nr:DUF4382 domain-containing protein [Bdellovibrionales bacterium]